MSTAISPTDEHAPRTRRSRQTRPGSSAASKRRLSPANVIVYAMIALLLFVSFYPLYVVLKTALGNPQSVFSDAESIRPKSLTLFNFKRALGMISDEEAIAVGGSGANFNFLLSLRNSLIFTGIAGTGQIFFSTLAAYAFARLRFPGRQAIFTLMIGALMVPTVVLFIPNFIFMRDRGWLDTFQGQIAPFFLMTPFAVFFMRQFFLSFPVEMEESARIDGASTFKIFRSIVIPNSTGPLATLSILTAINLWNEFFWPFLIAKDESKYPLTVALSAFKSQQPQGGKDWTGLMAGTTLTLIPVLLLLIFLGRKVVESIQFSGSK
jgi:multiple sugar transport system permease protein